MPCAKCNFKYAGFDPALSPGGFLNPGMVAGLAETYLCMRCYIGYNPKSPDGTFWWESLKEMEITK